MRNDRTNTGGRPRFSAFTLVEIMIVVLIIGTLLAIALPNFVRTREQARAKACSENLTKIEYAKDAYMMDHNLVGTSPANVFTDAALYGTTPGTGYLRQKPFCPGSGNYSVNAGDTAPTCDYGGNTTTHVIGD